MTISQLNVSRLKEHTGATLSECENALIMANNDFEYALEILSENGKIKPSAAAKKISPKEKRVVDGEKTEDDAQNEIEFNLRPKLLNEYIGQVKVKEKMRIFIDAAKRGESLLTMSCFTALQGWERRPCPISSQMSLM